MDSSKDSDVVHFFSVPGAYLPGQDIHARYQIQEAYNVHARDWVGLFRVGWTSKRDYYTFEWAPSEKEDGQRVAKFLGSRLPHEDGNFYQFCYVGRDGNVCGASRPFQFSKSARKNASDDVEMVEVDEDSSLVLLRSRADAQVMELEKKIAELTQKNVNVEDSFVQVQSECQGAKVERDNASTELAACKEQLKLKETDILELKQAIAELTPCKEQLQQREKEILELKQTIAEATNKLKDLQEIYDQVEQALQGTTAENSDLQQLLAASEKTRDEQIVALTAANKTLAEQKEESETELRMQCANLEEQLRNVNDEKEIAKSRNEYYVSDNERLDQCVQDQKAQVATLEQELTELQEKMVEQQEKIAVLVQENAAVTENFEKEKVKFCEALQSKEHELMIVQENMCEVMGNIKEPRDILPKLSADDTVDKSAYTALQRAYEDVEVRWKKGEKVNVQLKDRVAELEERVKRCEKEYVAVVSENNALKKGSQQLGSEGNAELKEQAQKLEEELRIFQEKHDQRIADKNDLLQQQQELLDEKLTEVKGLQDQQKAMQTLIDTLNKENGQLKQQVLQIREENGRHRHHQRSPGAPRRPPPQVQTGTPVPRPAPTDSSTNACPVCQVRFPRTTNQDDIERHVNAHFDA